jgi:hypothetical protein
MSWLLILVVAAGMAVVSRFYMSVRKAKREQGADWDSKLIGQLRAKGQDPFQPHNVDFFFALPDEPACAAINAELEKEGFRVDIKAVPDNKEYPFSLHGTKSMRIHAMEMRERSRRFEELARLNRGRYDGWGSD